MWWSFTVDEWTRWAGRTGTVGRDLDWLASTALRNGLLRLFGGRRFATIIVNLGDKSKSQSGWHIRRVAAWCLAMDGPTR